MKYHNYQRKATYETLAELIGDRKVESVEYKDFGDYHHLEDGSKIYDSGDGGYEIGVLPREIRIQAEDIIISEVGVEELFEVNKRRVKNPEGWVYEDRGHFTWGMSLRNLLRTNGLKDQLLPTGNWDDYYVEVLEDVIRRCVMEHGTLEHKYPPLSPDEPSMMDS